MFLERIYEKEEKQKITIKIYERTLKHESKIPKSDHTRNKYKTKYQQMFLEGI